MEANSLFKKLKLNTQVTLLIVNAPETYLALLDGVSFDTVPETNKKYDFVQVFATTQAVLERICAEVKDAGKYDCTFWACYPKGTGNIKSDIKRESVWVALQLANLRPVSQVAIDETWSALRGRPEAAVGK